MYFFQLERQQIMASTVFGCVKWWQAKWFLNQSKLFHLSWFNSTPSTLILVMVHDFFKVSVLVLSCQCPDKIWSIWKWENRKKCNVWLTKSDCGIFEEVMTNLPCQELKLPQQFIFMVKEKQNIGNLHLTSV